MERGRDAHMTKKAMSVYSMESFCYTRRMDEQPDRTETSAAIRWPQRFFTLDERPDERHYRPVFTVFTSVLHLVIHLVTYIDFLGQETTISHSLATFGVLFVPCMKPTASDVRMKLVRCSPLEDNSTCYYDDVLRSKCFPFLYPRQLWRMVTVNFLHLNVVHLLFNVVKLLAYGVAIERKYGSTRMLAIYWLANLGACLTIMVADPSRREASERRLKSICASLCLQAAWALRVLSMASSFSSLFNDS